MIYGPGKFYSAWRGWKRERSMGAVIAIIFILALAWLMSKARQNSPFKGAGP